ncbi:stage II sporulation protein P [Bacillus ectoiniformans]|uniref:stage II sporulation protein P n=1 Tax=Bacillus ectoiniformans TaxID=1494429 RepID=UPI001958A64A|nr:stage II sporulation protein P [Bacillus ectoiniformans]MBM7649978.1 stage II sporulation protein P [Bacillus ectoiniformans]
MRGQQSHQLFSINLSTIVKGILVVTISLLSLFSIAGLLTSLTYNYRISSHSVNQAAEQVTGKALYQLYSMENKLYSQQAPEEAKLPSLSEMAFRYATNVRYGDPRSFLGREVPGFSIFDGKILVAGEGTDYTNMPIESEPPAGVLDGGKEAAVKNTESLPIEDPVKQPPALTTDGKKRVFVYFTHNREAYLPHLEGVTSADAAHHSSMNVSKVGEMLQSHLHDRGIGTEIDRTDIVAKLNQSGQSYSHSYQASRSVVAAAQSNKKELQYFIDIHRDSLRKKVTTATIGGKSYAKIVFVVGGEHANYEKNAKLAADLHKLFEKKYKGLSRGVILKKGKNTNGKFNQDLSDKAMLVEFGGVDNTFEELNRTSAAFADVFSEYYWQAEAVQGAPAAK